MSACYERARAIFAMSIFWPAAESAATNTVSTPPILPIISGQSLRSRAIATRCAAPIAVLMTVRFGPAGDMLRRKLETLCSSSSVVLPESGSS